MKGPGFSSGLCFMTETLSKPEVEYLGPMLVERLEKLDPGLVGILGREQVARESKILESILTKIDYPFRRTT